MVRKEIVLIFFVDQFRNNYPRFIFITIYHHQRPSPSPHFMLATLRGHAASMNNCMFFDIDVSYLTARCTVIYAFLLLGQSYIVRHFVLYAI